MPTFKIRDPETGNWIPQSITSAGVQSDWAQENVNEPDYIKNKPNLDEKQDKLTAGDNITIDENNVISANVSWSNVSEKPFSSIGSGLTVNESDELIADDGELIVEDDVLKRVGGGNVQSDWDETDETSMAFIKNKPIIPDEQIQSDWNQDDTSAKDFIKNKPSIASLEVQNTDLHINNSEVISDLPIASSTILGGIKVGENLTIEEDGTLNAQGGSGSEDFVITIEAGEGGETGSPVNYIVFNCTCDKTFAEIRAADDANKNLIFKFNYFNSIYILHDYKIGNEKIQVSGSIYPDIYMPITIRAEVYNEQEEWTCVAIMTNVDGETLVMDDGAFVVSAKTATTSNKGVVKPDGTTITVDADGTISATGGSSEDIIASCHITKTLEINRTTGNTTTKIDEVLCDIFVTVNKYGADFYLKSEDFTPTLAEGDWFRIGIWDYNLPQDFVNSVKEIIGNDKFIYGGSTCNRPHEKSNSDSSGGYYCESTSTINISNKDYFNLSLYSYGFITRPVYASNYYIYTCGHAGIYKEIAE